MNSTKHLLLSLICMTLFAPFVLAQEPQPAASSREVVSRDSRQVTIIIQQQQIRFTAPASAQEVRLEISNKAGEIVYDSGLAGGPELSWTLKNDSGEAVPSGLYAYTLTFKEGNAETSQSRRGHLIVERGKDRDPQTDRLWVTSQGAIGAEAALSGGELTVASGEETNVVGARIEKGLAAKGTPTVNLGGYGTSGQIPKFGAGDYVVNSVITEDFNGRIGIGTQTPGSALTVAGQIETTSGGIKFPNGTVQLTSAAGALFQVDHNATLTGNGTQASPLGVNVPALNLLSSVTTNGTLLGNGTQASPLGVNIPALNLLSSVTTNGTLFGNGTSASPLGIADNGVSAAKIAPGQVVKSLNGLKDNVTLAGSGGISITPSGNTLTIAGGSGLSSVATNKTLVGNGTIGAPLGVALPVKAALFVTAEGNIFTCYNGLTGEFQGGGTTNTGCGFTNNNFGAGKYHISLPNVIPFFVSVTALVGFSHHFSADISAVAFGEIRVNTFVPGVDNGAGNTTPTGFFLIVY